MFVEGCAHQRALPVSFEYYIESAAVGERNPCKFFKRICKETEDSA
jgi:hypothetical protein